MADKADHVNLTSSRFRDFCSANPITSDPQTQQDSSLHQPISDIDLTRLDHTLNDNKIPVVERPNESTETRLGAMQCCCGRPECAYLEHNNAALGGLERDLETAARLGQALLDRHEAYVKESQAEQSRLSSYVTDLESEKNHLQDTNHKFVVENRELLQKLEKLNTDFSESGQKVQDLENLLQDCEQEIRRLNGLTRKTQELEVKMLDMERECAELNKHFADGKEETRSTIARWKESERKVRELEQEVQKLEWAAKVDREKHEDFVTRMEKDRALDRELGMSEGRLKAAAAVQNIKNGGPREKQVVSNFVRDILQDNASLQAGIAELRELLQSSNDEVQNLREQVMLHQPIPEDDSHTPRRSMSLSEELSLSRTPPKQVQQELHVHHHYHSKTGPKKERAPLARKTSRRRALMPSGLSSSPSTSGVSTPIIRPERHHSDTDVPPLNYRTRDSRANRWSVQSAATTSTYMSSMASSPRSYYDRNSSIFDRLDREEEISRPTSPDSFILSSPMPFKRKVRPDDQVLSVFEEEFIEEGASATPPVLIEDVSLDQTEIGTTKGKFDEENDENAIPDLELTPRPSMYGDAVAEVQAPPSPSGLQVQEQRMTPQNSPRPPEKSKGAHFDNKAISSPEELPPRQLDAVDEPIPTFTVPEIRPSIRRRNSHDSLVSISGMDIHLAQTPNPNPRSALHLLRTTGANKHHFAPSPSSTRKVSATATQPLASVTEYTAISRPGLDNTPRASMAALSGIRNADSTSATPNSKGLIGSVGGWVRGKWGVAPTKSVADLRSAASVSSSRGFAAPSVQPHVSRTPTSKSTGAFSGLSTAKSSGTSQRSIDTTSIITSKSSSTSASTGKRSASATFLDVPKQTASTATSTSTSIPPRQQAQNDEISTSADLLAASFFGGRTPGINQAGPIPGFAAIVAAKRAPTEVQASKVDVSGLKESLDG